MGRKDTPDRKDKLYPKLEPLLVKRGITLYQLAQELNMSDSTLYEWKCDKYTPKIDKVAKIAKYFGVPLEYFIE